MAHKFVCDKCGQEFLDRRDIRVVCYPNVSYETVSISAESTVDTYKDLCQRCLIRLNDWMQPDAKQATK